MSNIVEPKILYSRTATGAVNVWRAWTEGAVIVCQWGQQDGKMQVSRATALAKNEGKKNSTTAEEQALKEVVALYAKQVKKKYSETLDTAGETRRVKPMLAQEYEKHSHKLKFPVTSQPKLDGCRALGMRIDGKVVLQSRGGDYYDLPHIKEALEPVLTEGMILDGELYIHGVSLQTITSLIRRPRAESTEITYQIYDVPSHEGNWEERHAWLLDLDDQLDYPLQLLADEICCSEQEVKDFHQTWMELGYEGSIIRSHEGTYREGYRSPHLLKLKNWSDAEFRIVGWKTGKGKFENVFIARCVTPDGKEFDVAPKGTAQERAEMLKNADSLVGQLMKVKYFDFTDENVPHFPVGLSIRYQEDL